MSHADEFAFTRSTTPRARKPHTCSACSETIPRGYRYKRWALIFDGSAEDIKQCWRCYQIWSAIEDASPNEPIVFTLDCGESWEDVFGELPAELAELAFALPGDFKESRPW
jgi:hypothetical protein